MAETKKTTPAAKTSAAKTKAAAPKETVAKTAVKAVTAAPVKKEVSTAKVSVKTTAAVKTSEAPAAKPAVVKKAGGKQIKVTLTKSACNATVVQKRTVQALGLKRPHSFKIHNDNPAIRGMIFRIRHMVKVEEV